VEFLNLKEHPQYFHTVADWICLHRFGNAPDGLQRAKQFLFEKKNEQGLPLTLVAVRNVLPLGMASLICSDEETKPGITPWISAVFVDPEHRKTGIGRTLCEVLLDKAAALGFEAVHLYTAPQREVFYTKQGWERVEATNYRGKEVFLMKKEV